MAGNIPLVGFHDLLCVFISGHKARHKTSSKDEVLIKHLAEVIKNWEPQINSFIEFSEMLKGCDAYIATGSNNTSAILNIILESTLISFVATELRWLFYRQ